MDCLNKYQVRYERRGWCSNFGTVEVWAKNKADAVLAAVQEVRDRWKDNRIDGVEVCSIFWDSFTVEKKLQVTRRVEDCPGCIGQRFSECPVHGKIR